MSFESHGISRRGLLAGAGLSIVATAGAAGPARPRPALAASTQGGSILRSETLRRGQLWVDEHVPYSQSPSDAHSDGDGHVYRPDCSGYVSMCWHLIRPSGQGTDRDTAEFHSWGGKTWLDSYSQLKAGDALLSSEHIVLFDHWTDKTQTAMVIYQEPTFGRFAEHVRRTAASYRDGGFQALRYNKIVDDAGATPDAHGDLWIRDRSAAGAWASSATELDSNPKLTAIAAASLPDGTLHVFTLLPGSGVWYRSRSAAGTWAPSATKIDSNGAIVSIAAAGLPDGTLHVQTVVPDSGVWDRARSTSGAWDSSATQIDQNGTISRVSSVGLKNGLLMVQTLVPDAGVWNRVRGTSGSWQPSATRIDDNDYIIDIAIAQRADGGAQFVAIVPESGIWTRGYSSGGVWETSATKMDENGSVDAVAIAGLPDGSMQINAAVTGSGIWTRTRSAAGAWDASALEIDTNNKIFDVHLAGLPDGTLHSGALVNLVAS